MKSLFYAVPLATLILVGCGGGSSLSGPNSDTQKGLGTLVVKVTGGGPNAANGGSIVTLDKGVKVVRDGKATFYDIVPGRHYVRADLQDTNLAGTGRNVDIEADKTLTITLELSDKFAPKPTNSPFPN